MRERGMAPIQQPAIDSDQPVDGFSVIPVSSTIRDKRLVNAVANAVERAQQTDWQNGVIAASHTTLPAAGTYPGHANGAGYPRVNPTEPVYPNDPARRRLLEPPTQDDRVLPIPNEPELRFHFRAAPWITVLEWCAREAGMSLHVPEIPPGVFTLLDERPHKATEALDMINDHLQRIGFIAVRNRDDLIVLRSTSPLLAEAIPYIEIGDLPTLGRRELATVAIPVDNGIPQGVAQEIEEVLSPLGRVSPLSSSRRVLVTDVGASLRRIYSLLTGSTSSTELPYFVYRLRNAPAEEVARAINEFLASNNQSVVSTRGVTSRGSTTVRSNEQLVVAETTTNSLLVRGEPWQIKQITDVINQLDRHPPQVVIQAMLVEVQLGNTDEFGLELGVQDSILFNRSVIGEVVTVAETLTTTAGTQVTNERVLSQTASPGFNFNTPILGGNTAGNPERIGGQGLTNFGVGRVNGDLGYGGLVLSAGSESVNVLLRALSSRFHIDILSRPQIRALDNHEATIQIGQQVPVVDGVAITAVGSANPVIRQDRAGIILQVTPRISPDGSVSISVNAEKSAFQLGAGTGVPIYTDATTGNVIEAPIKDVTSAQTAVNVRTGQTIVLGGMITRDLVNVNRQVPVLGDIPLLGELFKYRSEKHLRKELLIFLTPHIVLSDLHSESMKIEEMNRIALPYEDATQIYGPLTAAEVGDMCPPEGEQVSPDAAIDSEQWTEPPPAGPMPTGPMPYPSMQQPAPGSSPAMPPPVPGSYPPMPQSAPGSYPGMQTRPNRPTDNYRSSQQSYRAGPSNEMPPAHDNRQPSTSWSTPPAEEIAPAPTPIPEPQSSFKSHQGHTPWPQYRQSFENKRSPVMQTSGAVPKNQGGVSHAPRPYPAGAWPDPTIVPQATVPPTTQWSRYRF